MLFAIGMIGTGLLAVPLAAALMGLAGGCVLWWWVADHL